MNTPNRGVIFFIIYATIWRVQELIFVLLYSVKEQG